KPASKPAAGKPGGKGGPAGKPEKPPAPTALQATVIAYPKGSSILRNGKPLSGAGKGTVVKRGDVLKVGKGGTLDLRVGDQGTLRYDPGSVARFPTLLYQDPQDRDTQTKYTRVRLDLGTVLARLRPLKGKSRFVIETSSAVTAARGTSFL